MDRERDDPVKAWRWTHLPENQGIRDQYEAWAAKQSVCPRCAELQKENERLQEEGPDCDICAGKGYFYERIYDDHPEMEMDCTCLHGVARGYDKLVARVAKLEEENRMLTKDNDQLTAERDDRVAAAMSAGEKSCSELAGKLHDLETENERLKAQLETAKRGATSLMEFLTTGEMR